MSPTQARNGHVNQQVLDAPEQEGIGRIVQGGPIDQLRATVKTSHGAAQ